MGKLEGKVALVTGASRGIGAAVAHALSEEGVSLGLASRSGDDLGIPGAVGRPADVRDPQALETLVAATVERSAGSTSSSRTRASAPTARSSSFRPSTSTR